MASTFDPFSPDKTLRARRPLSSILVARLLGLSGVPGVLYAWLRDSIQPVPHG